MTTDNQYELRKQIATALDFMPKHNRNHINVSSIFRFGQTESIQFCKSIGINPYGHGVEWTASQLKDRNDRYIREGDIMSFDRHGSLGIVCVDDFKHATVIDKNGKGHRISQIHIRSRVVKYHATDFEEYGGKLKSGEFGISCLLMN